MIYRHRNAFCQCSSVVTREDLQEESLPCKIRMWHPGIAWSPGGSLKKVSRRPNSPHWTFSLIHPAHAHPSWSHTVWREERLVQKTARGIKDACGPSMKLPSTHYDQGGKRLKEPEVIEIQSSTTRLWPPTISPSRKWRCEGRIVLELHEVQFSPSYWYWNVHHWGRSTRRRL